MPRVRLKEGREKTVLRGHPWIFSGAILEAPPHQDGEILPVCTHDGEVIASAYFHTQGSIAGRVIALGKQEPLEAVRERLTEAFALREGRRACRLINAEGDGLPGLTLDRYNDTLVLQITTWGMERLKPFILSEITSKLKPRSVYEKSGGAARHLEGLEDRRELLYGEVVEEEIIEEHGVKYHVSITEGQKSGFFLDQREMRKKVMSLASGRRVLNCFAYTGGFSLAALHGGAKSVTSVEISEEACRMYERNVELNRFVGREERVVCCDAFEFLRGEPLDYDLIILDPPAFAKKRSDVDAACRGYKEINRCVFSKAPKGALLVTSSCSSYVGDDLFENIVSQAASEAGRFVQVVGRHEMADDHPTALAHPEGHYLKSLVLRMAYTVSR